MRICPILLINWNLKVKDVQIGEIHDIKLAPNQIW